MAMEDLLRIADRTEGLPDQALAQLTQAGGIEGVIAASEMKARNDIRQEASARQNMPQPPVINQLLATAMRPTMPAGPMAQVPMQQPMPDPMMTLQSMQPAPMPMAKVGGLVRRFQSGTQGTIGLQNNNLANFFGALENVGVTEDQYRSLSPAEQEQLVQSINDRTALKQFGIGALESAAGVVDAGLVGATALGNLARLAKSSRFGRALGLSDPGDTALIKPFDETYRAVSSMREGLPPVLTRPSLNVPMSGTPTGGQQPSVTSGQTDNQVDAALEDSQSGQDQSSNLGQSGQGPINVKTLPTYSQLMQQFLTNPRAMDNFQFAGLARLASADSSIPVGGTQDSAGANTFKQTATGVSNEMFSDLIAREKQYKTEVDNSLNKLKELENELPSKDNIKDRIKKQTDLGVASAFFNAAGNATPSFIETISRGLAGASNVMNKFSGQEQKELYQYAIDAYGREKDKANTAYQRQQDNLKRINDARKLEATYRTAADANAIAINKGMQDNLFKALRLGLDVSKAEAEDLRKIADDVNASINSFNNTALKFTETEQQLTVPIEQARIRLAAGGFEERYVPEARQLVNQSFEVIIPRLAKFYKVAKEANPGASPQELSRIARDLVKEDFNKNKEVGYDAVLYKYGDKLATIANAPDAEAKKKARIEFKQSFPWLNDEYLTSNIPL